MKSFSTSGCVLAPLGHIKELMYQNINHQYACMHCKKLEVDLTQENVISVALWIHLGPGSGPPPVAMVKGYTPFPVKDSSKT